MKKLILLGSLLALGGCATVSPQLANDIATAQTIITKTCNSSAVVESLINQISSNPTVLRVEDVANSFCSHAEVKKLKANPLARKYIKKIK